MVSAHRGPVHLNQMVTLSLQGSIVSAIGGGINAIISAIANVIMTIVSAIVTVSRFTYRSPRDFSLNSKLRLSGHRHNN